jgi:hypothetical protein
MAFQRRSFFKNPLRTPSQAAKMPQPIPSGISLFMRIAIGIAGRPFDFSSPL